MCVIQYVCYRHRALNAGKPVHLYLCCMLMCTRAIGSFSFFFIAACYFFFVCIVLLFISSLRVFFPLSVHIGPCLRPMRSKCCGFPCVCHTQIRFFPANALLLLPSSSSFSSFCINYISFFLFHFFKNRVCDIRPMYFLTIFILRCANATDFCLLLYALSHFCAKRRKEEAKKKKRT